MNQATEKSANIKIVADNRKARFHYEILETFEAGIVLTGAEIKSIREGHVTLTESWVRPNRGELYWVGAHILPYSHQSIREVEPVRDRKLLMHKREITRLSARVEESSLTLIPLKIYLKNGRAKLELALARGKAGPDKRESIREREASREVMRAIKSKR